MAIANPRSLYLCPPLENRTLSVHSPLFRIRRRLTPLLPPFSLLPLLPLLPLLHSHPFLFLSASSFSLSVRFDATKLCRDMRRPVARKASNIGIWLYLLQGLSIIAAVTNCAHIGFTSSTFGLYFPTVSTSEKIFCVFAFEHVMLALQFVIHVSVPKAPSWVRQARADRVAGA